MGFLEYDDERAQVQTHVQYVCALLQYVIFLPLSSLKGNSFDFTHQSLLRS